MKDRVINEKEEWVSSDCQDFQNLLYGSEECVAKRTLFSVSLHLSPTSYLH